MKFSVAGVCTSTSLRAALAMVTYRLSGTLDRLRLQARYGTALQMDSSWNRWFQVQVRRQRLHAHAPEVAPARFFGHAFRVTDQCHGIVRHLEGCFVSQHSGIDLFESSEIQTRRYLGLGGSPSCLVTLMVSDFGRVIYLT